MTDKTLQEAVIHELDWDPKVDSAHIGVIAKNHSITLTGHVSSYTEKHAAVKAAERVYGVKAVADDIEVKLPSSSKRDDSDIAGAIAERMRWSTLIPDSVEAEVRSGIVTLRGNVKWHHQRQAVERAVRDVKGVRSVLNLITVTPEVKPPDIERRISEAIQRNATLDAQNIQVTTRNGTVRLSGYVHSLWEKQAAETAAGSAPGVREVDNDLVVTS